MTNVILILFVIFCSASLTVQLQCPPGEVEDPCPSACYTENCPTKELKKLDCSDTGDCEAPRCKCTFNKRRALNGTCVDIRSCPPFKCDGPNEDYEACPPVCPTDDCTQASPDGECHNGFMYVLTVMECNPACRCVKGHWRKDGKCVPYEECPKLVIALPLLGY